MFNNNLKKYANKSKILILKNRAKAHPESDSDSIWARLFAGDFWLGLALIARRQTKTIKKTQGVTQGFGRTRLTSIAFFDRVEVPWTLNQTFRRYKWIPQINFLGQFLNYIKLHVTNKQIIFSAKLRLC
jgi:hypothetical protein